MAIEPEFLKTACYFRNLDTAALEDISQFLFEKKSEPGEYILWEGEKDGVLYFVIKGLVKLFSTSTEGREFIVRVAYGGDSINDEGIFDQESNVFSAATMSPVVLYGLRYEDLTTILAAHPAVSSSIAEVLAVRQRYFSRLAVELVFNSATSRLAHLLLDREKMIRAGEKDQKITQQDMASMIGTVREIVGRSLRELEEMGAIRLDHNRIIIRDSQKLRELSRV
jgi:CRP/FNR family cyclic AMP-dependent transcriptional regulator